MLIRKATREDLPAIVKMLSDDELGSEREQFLDPLPAVYERAFENIVVDSNQELVIAEIAGEVVGTLQLTFIQYLTYQGGIRAQIEAVRIRADKRGTGLGTELFSWAIARARSRNAHVLQLTSDKKRPNAIQFYRDLGFEPSHEGMKMHLHY